MADDEEYDEVDAVVRKPKGERLADSRKTEGWSRGFTPKSADKGPEHVEIRLKDERDSPAEQEPDVIYVTEYVEAARPRELSVAEQMALDFLSRAIDELFEAAKPAVAHWWDTRVIPAVRAKREHFFLERQARKVETARRAKATTRTLIVDQVLEEASSPQQVATASNDPKITMTSEQFQQLLRTWLAREDAQQALWHAIANARIEDDDEAVLAWRDDLNELLPQQQTARVTEILSVNPTILENLGQHLMISAPLEPHRDERRRDES